MIISSAVCPDLHDPTNGDVSVATYFVGGIASYMCNPGYDLDGSSSLTCQSNRARVSPIMFGYAWVYFTGIM